MSDPTIHLRGSLAFGINLAIHRFRVRGIENIRKKPLFVITKSHLNYDELPRGGVFVKMKSWQLLQTALQLLSRRDRRIIYLIVLLQVVLSIFDLIGVLLLGLVAALTAAIATGDTFNVGVGNDFIEGLPQSSGFILLVALIAALFLISKSMLSLYITRRTFRFLARRQALISGSLAQELMRLPLLQIQARSSQEVSVALTSGVAALTIITIGQSVVIAAEISVVTFLFIALLFVDPLVACFTLIFFGVLVGILQYFLGPWAARLGRRYTLAEIGSIEAMQHALKAYREVAVSGRRALFISKFQGLRWEAANVQANGYVLNQISKYVFEVGLIAGGGGLVLIVATTKNLTAAVAIITVFLAASTRVFPSLLRMQGALTNIRNAEGVGSVTIGLIAELNENNLEVEPTQTPEIMSVELDRSIQVGFEGFVPSVSVQGVSLRYPGATDLALDAVSVEIYPSQSVALVGATGAGKSTLADVLLGVLHPDKGNVLISDFAPKECVQKWPGAMAYVPQEVSVLTGTVRENVGLGIPREFINDSLVWEALEQAHLSNFLRDFRDGIDTVVGENGVQLSGGQRQRLGIARALYSRPRLLVLDEATSALDAETERIITETLDSLAGDVTLVVIAHRLATVRHCDQVIHMAGGRITGSGTFEEVRAQVPEFNRQAKLLGL